MESNDRESDIDEEGTAESSETETADQDDTNLSSEDYNSRKYTNSNIETKEPQNEPQTGIHIKHEHHKHPKHHIPKSYETQSSYASSTTDSNLHDILEASLTRSYSDPEINRRRYVSVWSPHSHTPSNVQRYDDESRIYQRPYSACSDATYTSDITDNSLRETVRQLSASGSTISIINVNRTEIFTSNCENVSVGSDKVKHREHRRSIARKNIIADTEVIIRNHKSKDTYCRTRAFKMALDKLRTCGVAIVIGYPGDGRTSLGIELLSHFQEGSEFDKKKTPVQLVDIYEWRFLDRRENLIVFIDDALGYNSGTDTKQKAIFDMLLSYVNNDLIFFVITINKFAFNVLEPKLHEFEMFAEKDTCIVDLSDETIASTTAEKHTILKNHLLLMSKKTLIEIRHNDDRLQQDSDSRVTMHDGKIIFPHHLIDEISEVQMAFGYPKCCAKYTSRTDNILKGKLYFLQPLELLCAVIDYLRVHDKVKFLVFLLILHKDKLSVKTFRRPRKEILTNLGEFQNYFKSGHVTYEEYLSAIICLDNIFIRYDNVAGVCRFLNEAIAVATFLSLGRDNSHILIKHCSAKALANFFSADRVTGRIQIKQEGFEVISIRFIAEIKKGNIKLVAHHVMFDSQSFLQFFFEYLKRQNLQYLLSRKVKANRPSLLYYILTSPGSINLNYFRNVLEIFLQRDRQTCYPCTNHAWQDKQLYACLYLACKQNNLHIYFLLIDEVKLANNDILTIASRCSDIRIYNDLKNVFPWQQSFLNLTEADVLQASSNNVLESTEVENLEDLMESRIHFRNRPSNTEEIENDLYSEALKAYKCGPMYRRNVRKSVAKKSPKLIQ